VKEPNTSDINITITGDGCSGSEPSAVLHWQHGTLCVRPIHHSLLYNDSL